MRSKRHYRISRSYASVGSFLSGLRKEAGLTQRAVSGELNYSSPQFISNFERGISTPPLKKLKRLLDIYNGDVDELIKLLLECERERLAEALRSKRKT